ncbi:MAG: hypothetical protein HY211_04875 [Candidatus Omnitrophica bacterium]|nr:hypothetical protein [Candidatus Omnitrophota bacterium]
MMQSVEGILKEELKRLGEAEKSYRRELKKLPRGSIQYKKIKGVPYPYLVFRKGGKVVSKYLGRLPKEELEALKESIKLRGRYQPLLSEVRRNRFRIERMVYGKRSTV